MDTSTSACSVALWCDGAIVSYRLSEMSRGQAEALAPMIAAVLDEAGLNASALDLLAVTVGPGAFTGLRIGLATARALALAADVPCLGLSTTEVIAQGVDENAWPDGCLLVALDSKRSDIYVQMFSKPGQAAGEPQAIEPEKLGQWLGDVSGHIGVVGDAGAVALVALSEKANDVFAVDASGVPDARAVAALAAQRWNVGDPTPSPTPLYLRPPDAKLPRDGGRLRP
ncbi:MAG: tRNA (adenosine(37)-N6)-threonylcarbamoyltransferase complex dimerization subunit type 1 TsaB [Rhodospirillaceae bacterium]|nr:tRNA (adenosine(37)-N6)-threonylcarbamoyltransferase complex dimerization subunit type 1 TsaB [Rhodospirillaceae bacterium]